MGYSLGKIVLKSKGHHDEGVADAVITPGQAIRMQSDGGFSPETLAQAAAIVAGLKVAKESGLPGSPYLTGATQQGTVDATYAIGATVFFYCPVPGDEINALVDVGQTVNVGDYLSPVGSTNGNFAVISSSQSAPYPVRMEDLKAPTALATPLGTTGSSTIIGLVTGTVGTAAPTLQSADSKAASQSPKAIFEFVLPNDYRAGSAITLRANAGMLTTVADTSATLTVEAWKDAGDGTVGSNLGPAAQSINSLTAANKDFVITPTGLVAGDRLVIRLTFAIVDGATATAVIAKINALKMLIGNAVGGMLEALEASGGALAAATLLRTRVLKP